MIVIASPIGPLGIEATADAVTRIWFHAKGPVARRIPEGPIAAAQQQLDEYFEGGRTQFTLPLAPEGTAFQQDVWEALTKIPYGETTSYGVLARRIGKPAAVRAVGAANGRNPIPIVIPCHRVIGRDGKLVGFGGGLRTKQFLLRLEQGALF
jgi:methylated-DNA-[protein]-cysteine S-methyltransferase